MGAHLSQHAHTGTAEDPLIVLTRVFAQLRQLFIYI